MAVLSFYKTLLEDNNGLIKKNKNINNKITLLRAVFFLLLLLSIYWCFKLDRCYYFIGLFLIGFLYTIRLYNKFDKKIVYLKAKTNFLNDEIDFNHNSSDNGNDLANNNHFFSSDIDLFGPNSLFSQLNKTCTIGGRITLANKILNPSDDKTHILEMQEAVKEMMKIPEWGIDFIVTGRLIKEDTVSREIFSKWMNEQNIFHNPNNVRNLVVISRIINGLVLGIVLIFSLSYSFIIFPFLIELILIRYNSNKINTLYHSVGNKTEYLKKQLSLISKIEEKNFTSTLLNRFSNSLVNDSISATTQINELTSICAAFDNRKNIFISALLNVIFLWDISCAWKLENWKSRNKVNFDEWFDTISEYDSIVSVSLFSFNHPDFVFPEITKDEDVLFDLKGVAHPLINPENNIGNDFSVKRGNTIFLITGANMAGKSTFLRTIAINLVLAMIGAKVCAKLFSFSPMKLITSMRNIDSIEKKESFFLSELNRLKMMLNYINSQKETLVIIDEPLRGTNSLDKTVGSTMLIKKILSLRKDTCVLLATHDIMLTEITKEYPQNVIPKYFDIEIVEDQIEFDYKIKNGIASKMNAVELMKNILIIE